MLMTPPIGLELKRIGEFSRISPLFWELNQLGGKFMFGGAMWWKLKE
jgi:hypothetical protein